MHSACRQAYGSCSACTSVCLKSRTFRKFVSQRIQALEDIQCARGVYTLTRSLTVKVEMTIPNDRGYDRVEQLPTASELLLFLRTARDRAGRTQQK